MKKRLLALALAGTTAFSVFSMTAFAGSHDADEKFNAAAYTKVAKIVSTGTAVTAPVYKDVEWAGLTVDFEEVMDETVVAGTVYMYDFIAAVGDGTGKDMDDVVEVIDTEKSFAKLLGAATYNSEKGYGEYASIRREITDAFAELQDTVANTDYTVEAGDPYDWTKLETAILGTDETNVASSYMVFLMQEYNRFVEDELVEVEEIDLEALADLVIEALEARSADDYKKSSAYHTWSEKFEDLMEDYDEADNKTEYSNAYEALYKALTGSNANTVKADLDELEALRAEKILGKTLYPVADYTKTNGKTTDEYNWYIAVLGLAKKMGTDDTQASVDVVAAALEAAIADLVPTTTPKGSAMLALEEDYADLEGLVEGDYTKSTWKDYVLAMDYADSILNGDPGVDQVKNAKAILVAITAEVEDCANHTKVKSSKVKALDKAIEAAEDWLEEYDETASAAQILAVTKALTTAEKTMENHKTASKCALVSEIDAAIAGVESALDYADIVLGWSQDADGNWMYATETGYVESGWYKVKDNWCWFEDGKAVQSSWRKIDGTWYYLNAYCFAARGWAKVDGKWYFFNDGCAMLANTTVDGYVLDASGAWVE